jgi:tetratricopeptide (TPR) repeat protein
VLLPAPGGSFILVTSRQKLLGLIPEGALLIDVLPLDVADSVALLETALGAARLAPDHADAELLASLCGGLPIALSVVAARLAARPGLTLGRLVADLAVATNRLRGLDNAEGTSVRGTLDLSYSGLLPQVAMLYRRLAAHPGREFGLGPVAALISLIESDHDDASSAIDPLLRANLLEEPASDRFRYHDLLLLHAQQQLTDRDTPADRERVLRTMLDWYLSAAGAADQIVTPYRRRLSYQPDPAPVGLPVFTEREEALAWLELERVNLIAAARAALDRGWGELAWRLSDVMWPLLLYHKHYRDRIEIDECGVAGARLWGHKWAEADMHKRAGRAYTTKRRYDEAERHLEAAIRLGQEIGDRRGVVDAQEMTAALLRDTGRADAAIASFEEVLAANRELGGARNIGMTLISLGALLPTAGRAGEALILLREAKEIFARLVDSDPYNGVRVDIALAVVYVELGDVGRAWAAATSGEEGMRRLGSSFEQAQAIELLGRIAYAQGDAGAAERHWTAALAVYETLVSPQADGLRQKLAGLRRGPDPLPVQDLGETDE